jgi:myo-inositol-hexaphosphate 3-phosphohydrolase
LSAIFNYAEEDKYYSVAYQEFFNRLGTDRIDILIATKLQKKTLGRFKIFDQKLWLGEIGNFI